MTESSPPQRPATTLITGAAGNLGGLLARYLAARGHPLRLMYHRRALPDDEEERSLFERTRGTGTTPIVLRLGMVYGRGVLMIEGAHWLARHRLLGVWRQPTLMQLLSTADFLAATEAAIVNPGVQGIYHVGDEQPVTLQHFLDEACRVWGYRPPFRLPVWAIYTAAALCEAFAFVARTPSPLTRDFIRIGRVSHWGDTRRAREDLIPTLKYPNLASGLPTL